MNAKGLEREGLLKKVPVSRKRVKNAIHLAKRDLQTAKKVMNENLDWAHAIAYSSILQASRALIFSEGYQPSGSAQHKSMVRYLETRPEKEIQEMVFYIDRMRRRRHAAVYDVAGSVSILEAEMAIRRAQELIKIVEKILSTL